MSEALTELELIQGEDTRYSVVVKVDGAVPAEGISDWSFELRFFNGRGDADSAAVVTLTSAAGDIYVFNATTCTLRVVIEREKIATLARRQYWFRLMSIQPGGDRDALLRGWVTITH